MQLVKVIGAFDKGWIIAEVEFNQANKDRKIMIIDQHAAHGRVRLEFLLSHPSEQEGPIFKLDALDKKLLLSKNSADLEAFKSRACQGAVKITDKLDKDFHVPLLNALFQCRFPFICAHGRPTMASLYNQ